jgi:PAS domain S-box-containing protein
VAAGQAISTRHGPGCLATTGYAPADYEADPYLWFRMIYPEDRPTVLQHLAKLENGERISPLEHRILHRDGTIRWIRNSAIPSYDAIGQLCHYDGLVEDITARKLAELALRKNEAELLAARDVQQRLLPAQPPPLPGCDLAGASFPCDTVGGDYFDYLPMLDDRVGIVIADGSGHGLAPALLAAELRATLRTLVQTYRTPGEIITLANRILFPGMAEGYFITVLFTCFQPRDRDFSFISAGHPLPVILDLHGNVRDVPPASGLPIGVLETPTFASGATIRLNEGDTVLLWSDGMYEVASPGGPMLGPEALVDLVRQYLRRPAREIIEVSSRRGDRLWRPEKSAGRHDHRDSESPGRRPIAVRALRPRPMFWQLQRLHDPDYNIRSARRNVRYAREGASGGRHVHHRKHSPLDQTTEAARAKSAERDRPVGRRLVHQPGVGRRRPTRRTTEVASARDRIPAGDRRQAGRSILEKRGTHRPVADRRNWPCRVQHRGVSVA